MDVPEMITPDIESLLPSEQTVRARGHALTAQLGPHQSRGLHRGSLRPMRFVAALGAIGAIAGVGVLAFSDGDVVSQAQAFPVFATPHVTPQVIADGILGSFLKSEGEVPGNPPNPSAPDGPYWREAASHAYAFPTYWGTAYTFKKYDSRTGYTVCTVYPDYQTETIPYHGGWVGGCHTAPTIASAAGGWETVPDPRGVEFVQLVSASTTAEVTAGSTPAKAVPIHNGVLSVRVTSQATLAVHSGSSTHTYHLDSTTTASPTARGGTSNSYRSFAVFARKR